MNPYSFIWSEFRYIDFYFVFYSRAKAPTYTFDHRFPNSEPADVLVILYARLGTAAFQTFHRRLRQLAINKEIDYIFRHFIPVSLGFIDCKNSYYICV